MKVHYKDSTYIFKRSFQAEQKSQHSNLLSLIRTLSKDLPTVDTKNSDNYEESMRLETGEDTKHLMKFKKGHVIKEIVLKYFGGEYMICEITASTK